MLRCNVGLRLFIAHCLTDICSVITFDAALSETVIPLYTAISYIAYLCNKTAMILKAKVF